MRFKIYQAKRTTWSSTGVQTGIMLFKSAVNILCISYIKLVILFTKQNIDIVEDHDTTGILAAP